MKKYKSLYFSLSLALALVPTVLFAQASDIFEAQDLVMTILDRLGYFLWLLALMVFFWGLVKFVKNAADTKEHEQGKHLIVWGIISFLVLVSLWAIVRFILVDTLGIYAAPVCYVDRTGTQICN